MQLKELKNKMIDALDKSKRSKANGHLSRDLQTNWGLKQVSQSCQKQPTTPAPHMSRNEKLINENFYDNQRKFNMSRQQSIETKIIKHQPE